LWRVVRTLVLSVGSVVGYVVVYYLLPLDTSLRWVAFTILVFGIIVLIVLVVHGVRSILRSPFPVLRAVETLALTIPMFLVLFAGAYVVMDRISPSSFTQTLTHTDALYFAVTVFSTVGFGDITARTEAARILVTIQMIMDLIIIGLAVQAIVEAARRGRQSQSAKPLFLQRRWLIDSVLNETAAATRAGQLRIVESALTVTR